MKPKKQDGLQEGIVRVDKADKYFSWYVRLRDKFCVRCGSEVKYNEKGWPNSHTTSHYFGRRKESVRYEPDNCDTLCHGCHRYWEVEDRESYRSFKIKQLGQRRFDSLTIQANGYLKKDRKLQSIVWQGEARRLKYLMVDQT